MMATMLVLKVSAEMTNKSLIDLLTMIIINEMYVNKYLDFIFSICVLFVKFKESDLLVLYPKTKLNTCSFAVFKNKICKI